MARRFGRRRRGGGGARGAVTTTTGGRPTGTAVVEHWEAQQAVLVGPVIAAGFVLLVGFAARWLYRAAGPGWAWSIPAAILVCTVGVGYAAYKNIESRSPVAVAHTLLTTGVIGGYWALVAVTGLVRTRRVDVGTWSVPWFDGFVQPTVTILVIGSVAVVSMWLVRLGTEAKAERDAAAAAERGDEWAAASVPGVTGGVRKVNRYRDEGVVTLPRGMTVAEFQKHREHIESAWGWPTGSLRILPHPAVRPSSRKARLIVMRGDPLAGKVLWPGLPAGRPAKETAPIPTGLDELGDERSVVVHDDEGAIHGLITGKTGAGKTEGELPVLLTLAHRGAAVVVIDTEKWLQSFGHVLPALHKVIPDIGHAHVFLTALMERVKPARQKYLGARGLKQWRPGCGLSLLIVHIEEAHVLGDADYLYNLAATFRTLGIVLDFSLQRPSADYIPTAVKEQMSRFRAYGADEGYTAAALPDFLQDMGGNVEQWGSTKPGMHYSIGKNETRTVAVQAVRAYADPAGGAVSFAATAHDIARRGLRPLDDLTVRALGAAWTAVPDPVELGRRARSDVTVDVVPDGVTDVIGALDDDPGRDVGDGGRDGVTGAAAGAVTGTGPGRRAVTALVTGPVTAPPGAVGGSHNEEDMMRPVTDDDFGDLDDEDGVAIDDRDVEDRLAEIGDVDDPDLSVPPTPIGRTTRPDALPKDEFFRLLDDRLDDLVDDRKTVVTSGDFAAVWVEAGWSRASTVDWLKAQCEGERPRLHRDGRSDFRVLPQYD